MTVPAPTAPSRETDSRPRANWFRRKSLRIQLVVGSFVILVTAIGVADLTTFIALTNHLDRRISDSLRTAEARARSAPTDHPVTLSSNALASLVPSGVFVTLVDDQGQVIVTSAPTGVRIPTELTDEVELSNYPDGEEVTVSAGDQHVRLVRVDAHGDVSVDADGTPQQVEAVIFGADLTPVREAQAALLRTEVLVSLLLLAAWGAASWLMIGITLRPLRAMATTARRMAGGEPGPLPHAEPGTETGDLAAALNEAFAVRGQAESSARSFLADASHELKTPLSAIAAWTELYQVGGLATDDDTSRAMSAIEKDVARMNRLVHQMLELARLESSGLGPTQPVDLSQVVRDVVASLEPLTVQRVTVQTPPEAWLRGNRDQLHALVQNLLVNALTHAGDDAKVEVSMSQTSDLVVLRVRDDGVGMSDDEIDRAFDRFWRADRARSNTQGSGLGLPLVGEVTRQLGGTVTLNHADPHGLDVVVGLPTGSDAAT